MRKVDLGQLVQILANVGVLAGIVFLGFELRQNTRIALATASQNMANAESNVASQWIDYPDIVGLFTKPELTDEEIIRLHGFLVMWARTYENYWSQFYSGVIDEETLSRYDASFFVALSFPRNRNWWHSISFAFDPRFRARIDEQLATSDLIPTTAPDTFRALFEGAPAQ